MPVIHNSREEAHEACVKYIEAVEKIGRITGVWDVASAGILTMTRFVNENGNVQDYTYFPR